MSQVIQVFGSVLVLIGFTLSQLGRLDASSRIYLVMNLSGSFILAVDAFIERQWGFLLLEGIWALISGISLTRKPRGAARGT